MHLSRYILILTCLFYSLHLEPNHKPKDAAAHCNLGTALMSLDEIPAAIRSFQKAIEIEPQYGDAHCNLGSALGSTGDLKGAARSLRTAIVMDHRNAEAHCNLGTALLNLGDYDGAIRSYKEMLAMDAHGPHAGPARQGLELSKQLKAKAPPKAKEPAAAKSSASPAAAARTNTPTVPGMSPAMVKTARSLMTQHPEMVQMLAAMPPAQLATTVQGQQGMPLQQQEQMAQMVVIPPAMLTLVRGKSAEELGAMLQAMLKMGGGAAPAPPAPRGGGAAAADDGTACGHCGGGGAKMRCGRCRIVKYCSGKCQRAHWKAGHKGACKAGKPGA